MPRLVFTDLNFQNASRIINLPAPQNSGDACPKSYIDSLVEGLAWKDSCRVATQGNINLSSPGATVDGVTMAIGDRVLVRAQSTASQNGIYIWNGASTAMSRSLDASTFTELEQAVTTVEEGTSASTTYRQTAVNGTIDSTAVDWVTFGTAAPNASTTTAGLVEVATQAEVDAGTATGGTGASLVVTPATLAAWSGQLRKFSTNIGDGSATTFAVTHNLGTTDCQVVVIQNSNGEDVFTDVARTNANTVSITFTTAPAANAYRVVVIG